MNKYILFTLGLLLLSCKQIPKFEYPKIAKETVIDEYHGQKIEDPYRNLENTKDITVIGWLKHQKKQSDSVFDKLLEAKKSNLITSMNNQKMEKSFSISRLKITNDDKYFYLKKTSQDQNSKLYYRKGFKGKEILLFDPIQFSVNEVYSINYIEPSWDASKIVIGLTKNDEEFSILKVLDFNSKDLLHNVASNALPNALGGVEWLPDNSGFIYTYTPVINKKSNEYLKNPKAILYSMQKDTSIDIFSKQNNPNFKMGDEEYPLVYITKNDNQYTLGTVAGSSLYRDTYYIKTMDLIKNKDNWKPLFKKEDKILSFSVQGDELYFKSAKKASNFKICKTSLTNPDFSNPQILVTENPQAVITDYAITSKGLFYVRTKNGVEAQLYYSNNDLEKLIVLPQSCGNIVLQSKGIAYDDLWITTEGWTSNKERYKYNWDKSIFIEENMSPVVKYEELKDVVVQEIEIPSHDGVMVPLSIIYKKGIKKERNNRLLINAYGAYKWSNSPYLYDYLLHWVKEGGIYAVAHVRGGGEKGEQWHKGGFKITKPNSWKDLIACTEYLIKEKYTTNRKTVVWGASAGGIAIGRAITERPDLYSAAIIKAGILNPLRLESDATGKFSLKEFGSVKDSTEFNALYNMDPYHHINKNKVYPAVFLTAGINDARVSVWQPAKFAAKLQEVNKSSRPVILSVDFEGGHGLEASQGKKRRELSEVLAFAFWQTGHPDYQPKK